MPRYPKWVSKLPREERVRAKAIYLFMFLHKNPHRMSALHDQFLKLVEASEWPTNGTLPSVSSSTAKKLGADKPEWDAWRNFSKLRSFLRNVKKQLRF